MESEKHSDAWLEIGRSDVEQLCGDICESVLELERAFQARELSSRLVSGSFQHLLGPQIIETYEKLADAAPGPLQYLRADSVRALLAQLKNDLVSTRVAHAKVLFPAEGGSRSAESGEDPPLRSTLSLVEASFVGSPSSTLRFDQMLATGFWRIGFRFESQALNDAFARHVVRRATGRLASALLAVQRILDRFNPRTPPEKLRIVPYPADRRFEHLILDILNEDVHRARLAALAEDFLEKTDLRVKYPGLERKRGGRVQVTSITEPDLHEAKLRAIRSAEELVFFSPLSLAQFVDSIQAGRPVGSISSVSPVALGPFWDSLDVRPADVAELASELKRIMFRALGETCESPLGPMVAVPPAIRQLIRLFVETYTFASTSRLRERQGQRPGRRGRNESDMADATDLVARRTEFLRTLRPGVRLRGRVRNIVDYGAFIDLGLVDALLHVSEIPDAAEGMIGERLSKGDDIDVEILEVDVDKQRVSLRIPPNAADSGSQSPPERQP